MNGENPCPGDGLAAGLEVDFGEGFGVGCREGGANLRFPLKHKKHLVFS